LEKELSIIFMKSEEKEENGNPGNPLKQQSALSTEPAADNVAYHTGSDVTLNTTEAPHTCSSRSKPCRPSRWIDKLCLVLFPMMYVGFNVGYWYYYLP
jgi:hypothetical protein